MRTSLALAFTIGSLFYSSCFAAPGIPGHRHLHSHEDLRSHNDPIDEQHAIEMASEVITKLANMRKIDSSWVHIDANSAQKKTYSSGLEWVVTFNNPNIENQLKRKLYIFLTLNGKYIAANYTGN